MPGLTASLIYPQYTDWKLTFGFYQDLLCTRPVNLTGYKAILILAEDESSVDSPLILVPTVGTVSIDGPNGLIVFKIPKSAASVLPPGKYWQFLKTLDPGGHEEQPISMEFIVGYGRPEQAS